MQMPFSGHWSGRTPTPTPTRLWSSPRFVRWVVAVWVWVRRVMFQISLELGSEGCNWLNSPILPGQHYAVMSWVTIDTQDMQMCKFQEFIYICWLKITFETLMASSVFIQFSFQAMSYFFSYVMRYVLFFLSCTLCNSLNSPSIFPRFPWFRTLGHIRLLNSLSGKTFKWLHLVHGTPHH